MFDGPYNGPYIFNTLLNDNFDGPCIFNTLLNDNLLRIIRNTGIIQF